MVKVPVLVEHLFIGRYLPMTVTGFLTHRLDGMSKIARAGYRCSRKNNNLPFGL